MRLLLRIMASVAGVAMGTRAAAAPDLIVHSNAAVRILEIADGTPDLPRRIGELHEPRSGALSGDTLDYFGRKTRATIDHRPIVRHFAGFVEYALKAGAACKFDHLPDGAGDEMLEFGRGAGLSRGQTMLVTTVPDLGASHSAAAPTASYGCTSVGVRRGADFAVGRNLDFPGVGAWDLHPMIVLRHSGTPTGGIDRVGFTTEGLHLASISGINRAGLFYAVHQTFAKDGATGGWPIYLLGDALLKNCRSIPDALAFLETNRPLNLWTIVLADFNSNTVCAVEVSPGIKGVNGIHVRPMQDDVFAQANDVLSPVIKRRERISYGNLYNSQWRRIVAERAMRDTRLQGSDLGEAVRRTLAYQEGRDGAFTVHHDILKAETIQSVVIQRSGGRLRALLAIERAPVSGGRFAVIDLDRIWNDPASAVVGELPSVASPAARKRQLKLAEAHKGIDDLFKPSKALAAIGDEISPSALLMRAALHLQAREPRQALACVLKFDGLRDSTDALWQEIPAHIAGGMHVCGAIAAAKLYDTGAARDYARQILRDGIADPYHGTVATMVLNGAKPAHLNPPSFDFFAGAIRPNRVILDE